jgi:hypothetical protein
MNRHKAHGAGLKVRAFSLEPYALCRLVPIYYSVLRQNASHSR